MYRDAARQAKSQLELKLSRDVKTHKTGLFRHINNNQKQKENTLLNRRDELISPTMLKRQKFLKLLHLSLCQHCWASGLGNINPGWKHGATISKGRLGVWAITGAWPLEIDGPWQYSPEGVTKLVAAVLRLFSVSGSHLTSVTRGVCIILFFCL